jgi:hypothetical protein
VANVGGDKSNPDEVKRPENETPGAEPLPADDELSMFDVSADAAASPVELGDVGDGFEVLEGIDSVPTEPEATESGPIVVGLEDLPTDTESAEEPVAEGEAQEETEGEKKEFELPLYAELAIVGGVALLLLVLAMTPLMLFSTALYLIALELIPYGIWRTRTDVNVYSILLGCALAAVLTAMYCLWLELGRYEFRVKAPRLTMSQTVQSGFDTTTATA